MVYLWTESFVRSRARMGIEVPPFAWRYLLWPWGWRVYVFFPLWRRIRGRHT